MRIKGWLGRADQTTKVKGMFVHPEQVAEVAKRHAGPRPRAPGGRPRRRAGHHDAAGGGGQRRRRRSRRKLAETLQAVTKLKGEVEIVAPGTLPNDGKVIADERTYS